MSTDLRTLHAGVLSMLVVLIASAPLAGEALKTPAEVATGVEPSSAGPSSVSTGGWTFEQELLVCRRQDDLGESDRVRGAVWKRRFVEPFFAPSAPSAADVISESADQDSLAFAVVLETLLLNDAWIVGPAEVRGTTWQRWPYRRGDKYLMLSRRLSARGIWEVALSASLPEEVICPRYPPDGAYEDLGRLKALLKAGRIPWSWDGPQRRDTVLTLHRVQARDGHSFAEVAEWARYGGWVLRDTEREPSLAEVLEAGRASDRSQLLPIDLLAAWEDGSKAWANGGNVVSRVRDCLNALHLGTYNRSGFGDRTYPKILGEDPAFPLDEDRYRKTKRLNYRIRVDQQGRVIEARPRAPLQSTKRPHLEAMLEFDRCIGDVLRGLEFAEGLIADATPIEPGIRSA